MVDDHRHRRHVGVVEQHQERAFGGNAEAYATELFGDALEEYLNSGYTRLLIDLRGNPGGYLSAAVNIGRTRADDLLALKTEERCETALSFLL